MQLLLVSKADEVPANMRKIAMEQFQMAGQYITNGKDMIDYHTGFIQEWKYLREMYIRIWSD